jgi:hypothetical protein
MKEIAAMAQTMRGPESECDELELSLEVMAGEYATEGNDAAEEAKETKEAEENDRATGPAARRWAIRSVPQLFSG